MDAITGMTVESLFKIGTLQQKISCINEMIKSIHDYNKGFVIDAENEEYRLSEIAYDSEKDEVYCFFKSLEG